MNIRLFGDMSAQDALNAVKQGEVAAQNVTNLVNAPQSNGFPGWDAIFSKVWGVLTLPPSPATVTPVVIPPAHAGISVKQMEIGGAALLALGAGFLFLRKKRSRR